MCAKRLSVSAKLGGRMCAHSKSPLQQLARTATNENQVRNNEGNGSKHEAMLLQSHGNVRKPTAPKNMRSEP